jgi:hypothetical protein
MASAQARHTAGDLIWEGNVKLLEHEQRALVQPSFDRLSRASAWLVSIGSASSFEVRGVRQEIQPTRGSGRSPPPRAGGT